MTDAWETSLGGANLRNSYKALSSKASENASKSYNDRNNICYKWLKIKVDIISTMTMIINQRQWDRFNAPLFILTNSTVDQISLPHSNHHLWILEGGGAPCPLELVCCWLSWTFSLPLWKDQRCPLFQTLSSNFLRSEAILAASSWSESLTVHEEYYMYHMHQYYQMFYKYQTTGCKMIYLMNAAIIIMIAFPSYSGANA